MQAQPSVGAIGQSEDRSPNATSIHRVGANLSTWGCDALEEDPSQVVLMSDVNQGGGPYQQRKDWAGAIPGPNGGLVRQGSDTEYLIDPETSIGMLILKPTHQYST